MAWWRVVMGIYSIFDHLFHKILHGERSALVMFLEWKIYLKQGIRINLVQLEPENLGKQALL